MSADAPDVIDWFPGNRMRPFVDAGLLEPLDDVWADNGLNDAMKSSAGASTINGKKYALPMSYYNWGIYYRKDIFEKTRYYHRQKLGTNFIAVGEKLKSVGHNPDLPLGQNTCGQQVVYLIISTYALMGTIFIWL